MGKEKVLLKKILSNTELIMQHLKIMPAVKKETAPVAKRPASVKTPVKRNPAPKK